MWSFIALAILTAPDPGTPAPPPELPAGLEASPWAELEVDQCKDRLMATGLTARHFRFSKDNRVRVRQAWPGAEPIYCHVPQATLMWAGPTGVQYYGFTLTNCAMALAMTRMEHIAQEEARRVFGRPEGENPVRWISHFGTFNCRTQRFRPKQSEHSFGNGLDLAGFSVRGYGEVLVKRHWKVWFPAYQKPSEFLHALVRRLREEEVFTNVLDPDSDSGHWNHIHVDLAPLSDGTPSPALVRARAMPTAVAGDLRLPPIP